jgi:hypothetical protein
VKKKLKKAECREVKCAFIYDHVLHTKKPKMEIFYAQQALRYVIYIFIDKKFSSDDFKDVKVGLPPYWEQSD